MSSMAGIVDPSAPWRLSHILEGHSSDVKSVCASAADEKVELIHSAARDETARSWYRSSDEWGVWQRGASYQGIRFQNAVAHLPSRGQQAGNGTTLLGGLDARILAYETRSSYSDKPQSNPLDTLQEHYDNVCHLSVAEGKEQTLLISASWDCTSRVWRRQEAVGPWVHLHTLKGHERAVWAAEVVCADKGKEAYLTASADLFVRLWHGEELKRVFAGHTDVVRAITLLPPQPSRGDTGGTASDRTTPSFYDGEALFVTASNDGSLRVWSLDDRRCPPHNPTSGGDALRLLKGEDDSDLLYDVKFAGTLAGDEQAHMVVSCGENGLLQGWNVLDGSIVMSIPQPVSSVWSLAVLPGSGDIVTANSDGFVRVFTQRTTAVEADAEHREWSVGEVTTAQLEEHHMLCEEVTTKRTAGTVEAQVLNQPKEVNTGNTWQGRQYDQVLKIDVSDDAEPLSLPLNRGDDPRLAAKQFIEQHNLPASYEDQIVAFIEQVGPK